MGAPPLASRNGDRDRIRAGENSERAPEPRFTDDEGGAHEENRGEDREDAGDKYASEGSEPQGRGWLCLVLVHV